jgi:hypothetical protein
MHLSIAAKLCIYNHLSHTKPLLMLPAIWSEELYATLYAPQWTMNCLLYKFSP